MGEEEEDEEDEDDEDDEDDEEDDEDCLTMDVRLLKYAKANDEAALVNTDCTLDTNEMLVYNSLLPLALPFPRPPLP